jgi:hypothetical protein
VKQETETTAKTQCEDLIEERFPEGLIRTLQRKFPTARFQDLEDAVAEGFVKFLAKDEVLEAPAGYVTVVAIHYMDRLFVRAAKEVLPEGDSDDSSGDGPWADPTAEKVVGDVTFGFVRGIVETWQSLNVRSATLVVLEAVELEEPISSVELAEELESLLGEDVLPDTARQWRKRGLDRLRKELHELEELDKER